MHSSAFVRFIMLGLTVTSLNIFAPPPRHRDVHRAARVVTARRASARTLVVLGQ
jgi:hypothetical protein